MSKPNERRRLITLIHVAKAELDMDEGVYRDVLQRIGNADSASKLSVPKLQLVLEHFKKCGFKVRSKAKPGLEKPSRPLAQDPESRKARALWLLLHELGVVENPSEAALAAYAKRVTGIEALQWVSGDQAERLIETLKKWAMRYLPAALERNAAACQALQLVDEQREQLGRALAAARRGTFDPTLSAYQFTQEIIEKARKSCLSKP